MPSANVDRVLNRAVAWKLIDEPGQARGAESWPTPPGAAAVESWAQIRSVAERLGPTFGPMVVFAAATGLRPADLFALEEGDVDGDAGVVYVRRAFANGRPKQTKTRLSTRVVQLQAKALEALDGLPPLGERDPVPERARRPDRLPHLRPPPCPASRIVAWG